MKTLVLGCNGQLGQALASTVPDGAEYVGYCRPELDIVSADDVQERCHQEMPAVIINAAAYSAVAAAESETALATAVNVEGPRNVVAAASNVGARLIHISTVYVFDGESSVPYKTDDVTNPLSVYGRTKRDGERAVLAAMPDMAVVVRTAWLYSSTGNNFVKNMLRLMSERDELSVVKDQIGTPTWVISLATAVWAFAGAPALNGIFHWTDGGRASWHEFAVAIQEDALALNLLDRKIPIHAITSEDYSSPATRPHFSVLDCSGTCTALDLQPTPWRVNLRQMLKEMTN
jgi:dTDP-4-dehydrorhamnose reductase